MMKESTLDSRNNTQKIQSVKSTDYFKTFHHKPNTKKNQEKERSTLNSMNSKAVKVDSANPFRIMT